MNDSRSAMLAYLRVAPGSPWRWEEGGRVLAWEDGTTVAFREEIDAIIERLSRRGLPPFAEIALLLGACRGKFPPAPGNGQVSDVARSLLSTLALRNHQRALVELGKLSGLPSAIRESVRGKVGLAEAVFEGRSDLPANATPPLLGALATAFEDSELNAPPDGTKPLDVLAALWAVAEGLRRHTPASLQQRLATGLDALPVPAPEIELPSDQRARRLLGELARLPEYAGLAAAARDLMAAIRLPSVLAEPEEIALGGSSGLGNRGPLDRLVLSELAHDDLTLATRIALNEALYIQREPPALRPEHALVLVLDTGLRMWGIPRVVATSAALAFAATHHSTGPIRAWRGNGHGLESVDLLSQEGLATHLGVLSADLDVRTALGDGVLAEGRAEEDDFVLITHRDALDDPEFQLAAARLPGGRKFVLTIDHTGATALFPLPWGTPRPLGETRVNLEALFPRPAPEAKQLQLPLRDEKAAAGLPAIFREDPFPLLLAVNSSVECSAPWENGGACLTADRRLLRWTRGLGAVQVAANLPGGRVVTFQHDSSGRLIVVRGRTKDGKMSVILLEQDATRPLIARFPGPQAPLATFVDRHVLLVVLNTRVVVVSLESGEPVGETAVPPGLHSIGGRYFSAGLGIRFASWNGTSVQWDEVLVGQSLPRREIALAFERDGIGAWVLLGHGAILSPSGSKVMDCNFPVGRAEASDNGNRLIVWDRRGTRYSVDLRNQQVKVSAGSTGAETRIQVTPPTRPMVHRFDAVRGGRGQGLCLRRSKDGAWMEIFMRNQHLHLRPATTRPADYPAGLRPFTGRNELPALGCELAEATWPDGSRAWLDRRGLLHLKSSDPALPELTLAMAEPAMAAWSSAGQTGGPAFFIGEGAPRNLEFAEDILRRFSERL